MRQTISFLILFLTALPASAVPAKRGQWKTIRLADGTGVRVELRGDEYGHWWQAEDGTCYMADSTGIYSKTDMTTVVNRAKAQRAKAQQRRTVRRKLTSASTADGLGKYGTSGAGAVNTIGSYTFPVIMVQFSDTKFQSTTTVEKMKRYYNEAGYSDEEGCVGSVKDYFVAQSYGKFTPTFDVVGIVTLSKGYAAYGRNDSSGYDNDVDGLVSDAVAAAVSQLGVDFSKYVSGDGVPLVCILYAGGGEATRGGDDTVWPCENDCETTMSGTYFKSYFVGNELYGSDLMGMGVFCHETGHALGLPDWYCTNYNYSGDDPFGDWSIMDTGAYVADSHAPVGYTAYERSMLGWLDIPEVSTQTDGDNKVTLADPNSFGVSAVKITTSSSTENFILENRQQGTWYQESSGGTSYGSGLMLTRVAYNASAWNNDVVNNTQSKKRCMMVTADGKKLDYYENVSQANLYGNGVDAISSLKLYGGSSQAVEISGIADNGDGTLSFTYGSSTTPGTDTTVVVPADGVLFHETFDQCNGTGGNDGNFSGNVGSGKFDPDNDGWTTSKTTSSGSYLAYGGSKCAKFNNGKTSVSVGKVYSPSFTLNGDTVTLSFRAAPWSGDNKSLTVSLSGSNAEIVGSGELDDMESGAWKTYTLKLVGTGSTKIVFTPGKRFFLDDVLVVDQKVATGIKAIQNTKYKIQNSDRRIYTVTGQYAGTDLKALPKGIYIVGGRKVVH